MSKNPIPDPGPPSDAYFGKKPLGLEGLYANREARTSPVGEFGNADRKWRAQWIGDQKLTPADQHAWMIHDNPDYIKARYNIIRRIYKAPGNYFETSLRSVMSPINANVVRNMTTLTARAMVFVWFTAYYFKYVANDWTKAGGWKVKYGRPMILPGDSDAELFKRDSPSDYPYHSSGFKNSPI